MTTHRWVLCTAAAWASLAGSSVGAVSLDNSRLRIALDQDKGFAISQIEDAATRRTFIRDNSSALWELTWRTPEGQDLRLAADAPGERQARLEPRGDAQVLHLAWANLQVGSGTARVHVTGQLPTQSPLSRWSLRVEWTDQALRLWQVDFPRLGGIARASDDDMLTIPVHWGRYCLDPVAQLPRYKLSYPSNGSMQFWSFIARGAGLYLATHDSDCWLKYWSWKGDKARGLGEWTAIHLPPAPTPALAYEVPYPVMVGTFEGDWHTAAALYRQWALKQPWCREGKIADRETIPYEFKRVALWLKYYNEPGKVLHELWDHYRYLRVPMAVHYYRYPISRFDDNYPEMLPAKPGFIQGVRDMQALGAYVMPYTQGSIWDMDTESWRREAGATAAARQEDRGFYEWRIAENAYAWMCPAAKKWQHKVFDFVSKIVWDHGVDGVYLDVLSAGRARPCYEPSHGHPIHGGNSWGQGNRQLLEDLRRKVRAKKPHAIFTTEAICEVYMDKFDGFLTLDVTRGGYRPPVMLLPLFTAVYHDYAIQYGSDCALSRDSRLFCALLAEHFVWGAKLTLSEATPPLILDKPESAAYLRELAQCYDYAGRKFLLDAEWLRPPALDVAREPVTIVRRNQVSVPMPVVRRSLWRTATGDVGLVLTNWTAQPQKVDTVLRLSDCGLEGAHCWRQLWPIKADAGETVTSQVRCRLEMPPRSARVFELSQNPRRPMGRPARYDEDPPFIVLRREAGAFPTAQVEPGSIWYGEHAEVEIDAAGLLTLKALRTQNDFVLLHRHSAKLARPARVRVDWFGEKGIVLRGSAGLRLALGNPEGCQVVARSAGAEIGVTRQGRSAEIDVGQAPATVWLAGPVRGLKLTPNTFRYGPAELAACFDAAAKRWDARWKADASLTDLDAAAQEMAECSAAAEALCGAGLRIVAPPRSRAIPYEPLSIQLKLVSHTTEALTYAKPRLSLFANRRRGMARLDTVRASETGSVSGVDKAATLGEYRLLVTDRDLAEHAVSLRAKVEVVCRGGRYWLSQALKIPVDMPLLLALVERRSTVVAGRAVRVRLRVRNVAPRPVKVHTTCAPPAGWQVEPAGGVDALVPAAGDEPAVKVVELLLRASPSAKRGTVAVPFVTTYEGHRAGEAVNMLECDVLPRLRPLSSSPTAFEPSKTPARIRREGRALLYLRKGETARLTVRNVRVTTYVCRVGYRVLDPDLQEAAKGQVDMDQAREVTVRAKQTGTHFVELRPTKGSCTLTTPQRFLAFEATKAQPLNVIYQNPTLYFYVPTDAKQFALCVTCGGESEPAKVEMADPDGRVVINEDGALMGRRFEVRPAPTTLGKVWRLSVTPREDVSVHLEGDVVPYLSDHPALLLVVAAE